MTPFVFRPIAFAAAALWIAPALAGERFEATRAIDAHGHVEIENVAGSIRVIGSARSDVRVTAELGEGIEGVQIEGNGRRLKIRVEYPQSSGWGGWFGGRRVGDAQLAVELPASVDLKVSAVSAEVEIDGMRGRRVEADAVSGDVDYVGEAEEVELQTVSGGIRAGGRMHTLTVETVSGRAEVDAEVSDRLNAEAVSGDLRLSSSVPLKRVTAEVVSGDVRVHAPLAKDGRMSLQSLSGNVEVTLPAATSARLEASSFSGRINAPTGEVIKERYGPGSSLNTTLGSGEGNIRLESFSGSLRVKFDGEAKDRQPER